VDIVTTDNTKVRTTSFLKIDFNKMTSGKLAPAELIIIAITGPKAIPFRIRICEIGIIFEIRIYNGIPIIAAIGINHFTEER
jgi:hypothetical protein